MTARVTLKVWWHGFRAGHVVTVAAHVAEELVQSGKAEWYVPPDMRA